MSETFRSLEFSACIIRIYHYHVETEFKADGAIARAEVPWGDIDHIAACWTAGYGGDQLKMVREHEAAHAFLADEQNLPHSPSVWAAAHHRGNRSAMGHWPQHIKDEEHLVVSFQRYVNSGVKDQYDKLGQAFGDDLPALGNRFLRLMRPWLF